MWRPESDSSISFPTCAPIHRSSIHGHFHTADESSHLQTEIAGLRKANEALFSRLSNSGNSGVVSSGPLPAVISTCDTLLTTPDAKARLELVNQIDSLSDKCASLLASRASRERVQETAVPRNDMTLSISLSEGSLQNERDILWESLCSEECARANADLQANAAETKLAKAQAELKQLASLTIESPPDVSGLVEEAQLLRSTIADLCAQSSERVLEIRKCEDRIDERSRLIQTVGLDHNAQVLQHNVLLEEILATRIHLEDNFCKLQSTNVNVDAMRAEHASADQKRRTEIAKLEDGAQDYTIDLHCKDASLKVSAAALVAAKTVSLERKGLLAALRSAHDDSLAKSQARKAKAQQREASLEDKVGKLSASKDSLTKEITEKEYALKLLQVQAESRSLQLAEVSQSLAREQANVVAASDRLKSLHSKLFAKVETLTQQLKDEQVHAPKLSQEMWEATSAAGWQKKGNRKTDYSPNASCLRKKSPVHGSHKSLSKVRTNRNQRNKLQQEPRDYQVTQSTGSLTSPVSVYKGCPLEKNPNMELGSSHPLLENIGNMNFAEHVKRKFEAVDMLLAKQRKPIANFSYLGDHRHSMTTKANS